MDMRELIITPIIKSWPIVLALGGGVWKAGEVSTHVESNTSKIAAVSQIQAEHIKDSIDRLARIETKIDTIVEKK